MTVDQYPDSDWIKADVLSFELLNIIFREDPRYANQYTKMTEDEVALKEHDFWKELTEIALFKDIPFILETETIPQFRKISFKRLCLSRMLHELTESNIHWETQPKKAFKHLQWAFDIFAQSEINNEACKTTPKFSLICLEFKTQLFQLKYRIDGDIDRCKRLLKVIPHVSKNPGVSSAFTKLLESQLDSRLIELEQDLHLELNSFTSEKLLEPLEMLMSDVAMELNSLYKPSDVQRIALKHSPKKNMFIEKIRKRKFNQPHESARPVDFDDEEEKSSNKGPFLGEDSDSDHQDHNRSFQEPYSLKSSRRTRRVYSFPVDNRKVRSTGKALIDRAEPFSSPAKKIQETMKSPSKSRKEKNIGLTATPVEKTTLIREPDELDELEEEDSSFEIRNKSGKRVHIQEQETKESDSDEESIKEEKVNQDTNNKSSGSFALPSKKSKTWTEEEMIALEEAMNIYGTRWSAIEKAYGPRGNQKLQNRTQLQLKDKARVEKERRMREQLPLGPFELACHRSRK